MPPQGTPSSLAATEALLLRVDADLSKLPQLIQQALPSPPPRKGEKFPDIYANMIHRKEMAHATSQHYWTICSQPLHGFSGQPEHRNASPVCSGICSGMASGMRPPLRPASAPRLCAPPLRPASAPRLSARARARARQAGHELRFNQLLPWRPPPLDVDAFSRATARVRVLHTGVCRAPYNLRATCVQPVRNLICAWNLCG